MTGAAPGAVLVLADGYLAPVGALLARHGLAMRCVAGDAPIPGSYHGAPEAGVVGHDVWVRADTPLHSVLHEACHSICMDGARRAALERDAGGDFDEENAVCVLQILLADELAGVGAARPDLVLVWGDGQPADQRALLARLGLPVLNIEQHSLADVPATLERLGRVLGTEAIAGPAARELSARIEALRARYSGARRLRVFYQVWSTPLYTLGGRHIATEMLRLCGADNAFADQTTSAFVVDEEAVYARDPDVIALAGTAAENAEWLKRWQGRAPLRAVSSGNVITLDPDLVNRMGPRIVDGTQQLCERLAVRRAALDAAHR